ncbi:homodimeric glycerol 3-phosphate dehydrogenase (quinone) [Sphingomonas jatrophae]|uniref:Homodimeric glycerol 3-phosphate dehydrogenase (Quinone) n=2 Tax=Sphingomonas jatrophae TaxID=1166337 RepID=A0A1I6JU53_9SPHN|nr:homodimeric glycerol 3-phosphate dehydrogenase (quinone) [Sphingomonas jatrophae]
MLDLLVIGGGINGTAIARDAAGRGRSVLLVEADDLASHTSSASTKLIHGGLRYLETFDLRLVREALVERDVMLRAAPHLIYPLRFVLPQAPGTRPGWMIRAGLLLYDTLAWGTALPRAARVDLGPPLKSGLTRGHAYSDAWVDDARLVILYALDAAQHKAEIRTRSRLASAVREGDAWTATLANGEQVRARALVNAAGPWVEDVLRARLRRNAGSHVRLVRGSHIVVPRLPGQTDAYLLQQPDGRIVFAIPYERDLTLIGTTDTPVDDPADATASDAEVAYLLAAANRWLARPLSHADVRHRFAGIRALHDDGRSTAQTVTRDYRLELDDEGAPLLSVFGGKITTARALAEAAVDRLGWGKGWTRSAILPGGDLGMPFDAFLQQVRTRWPALGEARSLRMARAYGSRLAAVIGRGLGEELGGGLTAGEVRYLRDHEWARTPDDVLWRRTKIGLHTGADTAARVAAVLEG